MLDKFEDIKGEERIEILEENNLKLFHLEDWFILCKNNLSLQVKVVL